MADKKISQLTASTVPLAGTEVLPIVQGGVTKQVSVANLTAGRAVSAGNTTIEATGNALIVGSASRKLFYTPDSSGVAITTKTAQAGAGIYFNDTGDEVYLLTGGNIRATINAAGDTVVNTGNLVIGTSGKGIDFSADGQAAGMTSELLDDYEEGTWTAVVKGLATAGTYEILNNVCRYTKIGNRCFVQCRIRMNSPLTGGGSGSLVVAGLPYAKADTTVAVGAVWFDGIAFTGDPVATFYTFSNTTEMCFRTNNTGGAAGSVDISAVGEFDYINFSLDYEVQA